MQCKQTIFLLIFLLTANTATYPFPQGAPAVSGIVPPSVIHSTANHAIDMGRKTPRQWQIPNDRDIVSRAIQFEKTYRKIPAGKRITAASRRIHRLTGIYFNGLTPNEKEILHHFALYVRYLETSRGEKIQRHSKTHRLIPYGIGSYQIELKGSKTLVDIGIHLRQGRGTEASAIRKFVFQKIGLSRETVLQLKPEEFARILAYRMVADEELDELIGLYYIAVYRKMLSHLGRNPNDFFRMKSVYEHDYRAKYRTITDNRNLHMPTRILETITPQRHKASLKANSAFLSASISSHSGNTADGLPGTSVFVLNPAFFIGKCLRTFLPAFNPSFFFFRQCFLLNS